MANDSDPGLILTAALLAGGGLAGYHGGQWLLERGRLRARQAAHACPEGCAPTIDVAPPSPPASGALPRRFDLIFEKYRGSIPVTYLRALSWRESSMNAGETSGPAWGLMQVVEVVRRDYNRAHGTAHTRGDLLDPEVNVAIATSLLQRIIASYGKNHPLVPNLQEDWSNRQFVELLTFGWNAGYSEAGGVGRVARFLEARGITDLTIDVVRENAVAAGASRHLSRRDKVSWCKGVASLYRREWERASQVPPPAA